MGKNGAMTSFEMITAIKSEATVATTPTLKISTRRDVPGEYQCREVALAMYVPLVSMCTTVGAGANFFSLDFSWLDLINALRPEQDELKSSSQRSASSTYRKMQLSQRSTML